MRSLERVSRYTVATLPGSIPVFEDLLPEPHNTLILDLLFVLCTWHACAKLRIHTTTTLRYLKETIRSLGFILRKFATKTCSAFDTHELPREVNARTRRKATTSAKGRGSGKLKEKKKLVNLQRGRRNNKTPSRLLDFRNVSISARTSFLHWESTPGQFYNMEQLTVTQLKQCVVALLLKLINYILLMTRLKGRTRTQAR
jgi:hypothetical protein